MAQIIGASDGGFYDIKDLSSLYQTDDTSTPVTATGQSCGRINSPDSGARYVRQATAGWRPTYEVDGSGRPYLDFLATGQMLQTVDAFKANDEFYIGAACRIDSFSYSSTAQILLGNSGSVNTTGAQNVAIRADGSFRRTNGNLRIASNFNPQVDSSFTFDTTLQVLESFRDAGSTDQWARNHTTGDAASVTNTETGESSTSRSRQVWGANLKGRFFAGLWIRRGLTASEKSEVRDILSARIA